jgi:transposase
MNRYPNPNSILVCDNTQIHKGTRVHDICNEAGVILIYLPPYCPELNPIELCFSNFKNRLRRSKILTDSSDPQEDIRDTFDEVISPELCYKLYKHCGYSI